MEEPTSKMPSANISTALITVSLDVDKETSTWGWGGENDIDFRTKDLFQILYVKFVAQACSLTSKTSFETNLQF